MRRSHIVKVGAYWVNLAEVLYAETITYDDHGPEVTIHFRGEHTIGGSLVQDERTATVDAKDFEKAIKEASRPDTDY